MCFLLLTEKSLKRIIINTAMGTYLSSREYLGAVMLNENIKNYGKTLIQQLIK